MSLTQLEIKYAKAGMHSDGNGLYLLARKGGAKSWIFRYTFDGKRREMGLGALAGLSVVEARAEARSMNVNKQRPKSLRQNAKPNSQRSARQQPLSRLRLNLLPTKKVDGAMPSIGSNGRIR